MERKNLGAILMAGFLMVGLASSVFAQNQVYRSKNVTMPKQIDGQGQDWEGDNFLSFAKAGVDYSIAHDNKYLYLIMVFKNAEGLSTADRTGIYVYFSQAGKKKKDTGFHFQEKIVTAEEAIARLESYGEELSEERKNQIREKKMFIFFEGQPVGKDFKNELAKIKDQKIEPAIFRYKINRERGQPRPTGPRGSGFQNAVFEFRIPLIVAPGLKPFLEPGKPVSVGIEWGGMTEEMKKEAMARRAAAASTATATDSSMVVSGDEPTERGLDRSPGEMNLKSVPKKFNFWFNLLVPMDE